MKKLTALFTVAFMLVAATAFAAVTQEYPAGLNATNKFFTGFVMNKTASHAEGQNASMLTFNSTKNGFFANKTYTNATISAYNGSGWKRIVVFDQADTPFAFSQSVKNVKGLTSIAANNATNATSFFVPAAGYSFMVGLSNTTMNASALYEGQKGLTMGNGSNMQFIYDNGTFDGTAYDGSTWDYYAFGTENATANNVLVFAQVKLNSRTGTENAQVKYLLDNGGTQTDKTGSWLYYNATYNAERSEIGLTRGGAQTLLQNATINSDRNLITGWVNDNSRKRLFAVMVKSGSKLANKDLTNRAFKMVYAGKATMANMNGNATGGIMAFSVDNNLGLDGDAALINATQKAKVDYLSVDMSGCSLALADTDYFGLSQSNMTIYTADGSTVAGSFYGKQAADKSMTVGIYEPVVSGSSQGYNLAVLMPNPAVAGEITTAGAAYQNNGTLAYGKFTRNTTSYSQAELRAQWSDVSSDFTAMTDVKGFNSTITTAQKGDVYVTMQFPVTGIGDKVENLRLYKVFPTSAKTVREYNYASEAKPSSEGAWWISTDVADGYLNKESVLAPGVDYYINYVVKDNGNYDANPTALYVVDPVVLGSMPTSSSSSSSGCVFNPAAGFGLEWLLLMLAPMVAIVRSRFKK